MQTNNNSKFIIILFLLVVLFAMITQRLMLSHEAMSTTQVTSKNQDTMNKLTPRNTKKDIQAKYSQNTTSIAKIIRETVIQSITPENTSSQKKTTRNSSLIHEISEKDHDISLISSNQSRPLRLNHDESPQHDEKAIYKLPKDIHQDMKDSRVSIAIPSRQDTITSSSSLINQDIHSQINQNIENQMKNHVNHRPKNLDANNVKKHEKNQTSSSKTHENLPKHQIKNHKMKDKLTSLQEPYQHHYHPNISPREGSVISSDVLSHQVALLSCQNQSACIVPNLQLNAKLKVYFCSRPVRRGVRFYYLVHEGLLNHPNVVLLPHEDINQADLIIYLPASAPWHLTECNVSSYKSRLLVLEEFDGHTLYLPYKTREEAISVYGSDLRWFVSLC